MNRYQIRIDGVQSVDSYTYQELVDMGLFDLGVDGIEIKNVTSSNFLPLNSYYFAEKNITNNSSNYAGEFSQKQKSNTHKVRTRAYVDEYGQIVRPNVSSNDIDNVSNQSSVNTSSSSSSNSTPNINNSSNSNDGELFWKIVGSIVIVAIGLWILFAMADADVGDFWSLIPMGIGYYILKLIWGWED